MLARSERLNGAQLIDACRRVDDLPAALAALDLALWDRAGRLRGLPVAALLTDDPAPTVPVNATIAALDRAGVAERGRARGRASGFDCVKVKVGVGDDAGRVAAARAAAGPEVALRLDANGGWDGRAGGAHDRRARAGRAGAGRGAGARPAGGARGARARGGARRRSTRRRPSTARSARAWPTPCA